MAEGDFDAGGFADVAEAAEDKANFGAVREKIEEATEVVYFRAPIDGDVVELGELDSGFFEAVGDGLGGKAGPVLDAAKALFFSGSNELAVVE